MSDVFIQEDLAQIEKELWAMLQKGVSSYRDPFHHASVATVHDHQPDLRTVILRKVDLQRRELFFHSDSRSSKIKALTLNPHISLLFYDPELRVQLRCKGYACMHHQNAIAESAWQTSRLSSKLCYSHTVSPGTALTAPVLIDLNRTAVTNEELEIAYSHFVVVASAIEKIDWLFLHHKGHRRATFDYLTNNFQWTQA